jgi:hypothetical protein
LASGLLRGGRRGPGDRRRVAVLSDHAEGEEGVLAPAVAAGVLAHAVPLGGRYGARGDRLEVLLLGVEVLGEGHVETVEPGGQPVPVLAVGARVPRRQQPAHLP